LPKTTTQKGSLRHRSILKISVFVVVLLSFCRPLYADFAVQVGVFEKQVYADELMGTLRQAGFPVEAQPLKRANNTPRLRVIVGPYANYQAAVAVMARLKAAGHNGFVRNYEKISAVEQRSEPLPTVIPPPIPPERTVEPPAVPEGESATLGANGASSQSSESAERSESPIEMPAAEPVILLPGEGGGKPSYNFMGFFLSELAYAKSASPEHLSKFRNTLELSFDGRMSPKIAWKISGRVAHDAVYDLTDYYPTAVRDDQQFEATLRETYLDISAGDWDFRLGKQQIVWGEMVGLFFADVVSIQDLREFVLPDFDYLRIPQWAVRAEYYKGNFHGEGIWIPYPSYNNIGVPGSEFYPYPPPPPPGYTPIYSGENRPVGSLSDSNYGLRLSYLLDGWDLSGFYYNSMDAAPAFTRRVVTTPSPAFLYTLDQARIQQTGGTFSKDRKSIVLKREDVGEEMIGVVLKGEVIYTQDRLMEVSRLSDADGVVSQDSLDYVLGIDYSFPSNTRLNLQFFQRWYPDHDPDMVPQGLESGFSIYATSQVSDTFAAEVLWMEGINRHDWMLSPKLKWTFSPSWNWLLGLDLFNGAPDGFFGRYADKDRINTALLYNF